MHSLEDRQDCINRLRKIQGQIRGLQSMIEAERPCSDIMMQISSVKAATHQLGIKLFKNYLQNELLPLIDPDVQSQTDESLHELITILSRLK